MDFVHHHFYELSLYPTATHDEVEERYKWLTRAYDTIPLTYGITVANERAKTLKEDYDAICAYFNSRGENPRRERSKIVMISLAIAA
jgi:hypothetical protein